MPLTGSPEKRIGRHRPMSGGMSRQNATGLSMNAHSMARIMSPRHPAAKTTAGESAAEALQCRTAEEPSVYKQAQPCRAIRDPNPTAPSAPAREKAADE